MKWNGLSALVVVLLVSGLILGDTSRLAFAVDAPKTIKIGAMVSLTGPDAASGIPAKLGYDLAVEEINKTGGVMVKAYGKKDPS
jgi:branched-chain amino acid transport system substrate-binding protein